MEIPLTRHNPQPGNWDLKGTSANEAAPQADFLRHAIRLSAGATLAASLTLVTEVSISPIPDENELLTSVVAMGLVAALSGGIVIGDTLNNYCRGSAAEVNLLHHAIRLVAAVALGGSLMHLVLSITPIANGGNALLVAAGVMAAMSGLFVVGDTVNSYYLDGTIGCCNRTEIHKDERENLTVGQVVGESPVKHQQMRKVKPGDDTARKLFLDQ